MSRQFCELAVRPGPQPKWASDSPPYGPRKVVLAIERRASSQQPVDADAAGYEVRSARRWWGKIRICRWGEWDERRMGERGRHVLRKARK